MLETEGLTKRYGDTVALDDVTIGLPTGEVLAILGPSGSGKSTLLRVVAGLELPDTGTIRWDGVDLTGVPAHERRFGFMFQSYALFPHRSVGENVAFGLKMIGHPQIEKRTREALAWVGLEHFADRSVTDLSGGEQQRVALARTLAPSPRLVMLDEPLGALDRRLRERLVEEIRAVLVERGSTAIYVTHDHEEAALVSERVAIMKNGEVAQVGTLEQIRAAPNNDWVADFVA